jgi:Chemotaxis phosphatase CheX
MLPELEQQYSMDREPGASETIRQVAAEVLETMFFTEAELVPCEHAWLGSAQCGRIQFEGSHSGEMLLALSAEATEPIAASFLGLDPMELTDAQRGQVVQELSNIMCGALLSHLWPESRLALASPELTPWREWLGEGALHRCFALPEGMVALSIRLTSRMPGAAPRGAA